MYGRAERSIIAPGDERRHVEPDLGKPIQKDQSEEKSKEESGS